jgi:hypothetical protein
MSNLKLWDVECNACESVFEEWADGVMAPLCTNCGSAFTTLVPGGLKRHKAKDPYDYLDRRVPGPSVSVSVPKKYRSK